MPPQRSLPALKAANMKTERTHEENQERAYIAASRRSDRSLEARVESARRASEIHKRRTGRALRVTEQDVLNEEMYEEEEDDLPLPYRQLTQHLTTGSAEFNRRLAAYLTNHVAVRSALDQIIRDSHGMSANTGENFVGNFGQTVTPSSYAQPLQSPVTFADNISPSASTPQSGFSAQNLTTSSIQVPNSTTQFHVGPLGLSTVNQGQHRTAPYNRRMSGHQQDIQQQQQQQQQNAQRTMSWSEAQLTKASQLKISPQMHNQTMSTPPTPTLARPSGYNAAMSRRMSTPAPQTTSISSPGMGPPVRHGAPMQYQTPSPSPSMDTPMSISSNSPVVQSQSKLKGMQNVGASPDQSGHDVITSNSSNDQVTPQSHADLGSLNLSLAQNAQDLLYGGYNLNEQLGGSMMGFPSQQASTGNKFAYKHDGSGSASGPMQDANAHFAAHRQGKTGFSHSYEGSMNLHNQSQSQSYGNEGEYDLGSLMMDTDAVPFNPNANRLDSSDFNPNNTVDELWQDFFASESFNSEENNGPSIST